MIICKTPFRISFFGGGTDIYSYFSKFGGIVLSTTINKYCYVTFKNNFDDKKKNYNLSYNIMENVNNVKEIKHPLIREIFIEKKIKSADVHYDADLPGMSGLGTSSSFGVGLINSIEFSRKKKISPKNLASQVINIERNKLNEAGGYQDQISCTYGGFNKIIFDKKYKDNFKVNKLLFDKNIIDRINASIILVYLNLKRQSSEYSVANFKLDKDIIQNLHVIKNHAKIAENFLYKGDLDSFGNLLNETWLEKRKINKVSNNMIDSIYRKIYKTNLILGGKLLGAGGGGFMLFWTKNNKKNQLKNKLKKFRLKYSEIKLTDVPSKVLLI